MSGQVGNQHQAQLAVALVAAAAMQSETNVSVGPVAQVPVNPSALFQQGTGNVPFLDDSNLFPQGPGQLPLGNLGGFPIANQGLLGQQAGLQGQNPMGQMLQLMGGMLKLMGQMVNGLFGGQQQGLNMPSLGRKPGLNLGIPLLGRKAQKPFKKLAKLLKRLFGGKAGKCNRRGGNHMVCMPQGSFGGAFAGAFAGAFGGSSCSGGFGGSYAYAYEYSYAYGGAFAGSAGGGFGAAPIGQSHQSSSVSASAMAAVSVSSSTSSQVGASPRRAR